MVEQADDSGKIREGQRARAYQRGSRARDLKEAGQVWLEPHYPPQDADLAMAWLDGWLDRDAEIQAGAGQKG